MWGAVASRLCCKRLRRPLFNRVRRRRRSRRRSAPHEEICRAYAPPPPTCFGLWHDCAKGGVRVCKLLHWTMPVCFADARLAVVSRTFLLASYQCKPWRRLFALLCSGSPLQAAVPPRKSDALTQSLAALAAVLLSHMRRARRCARAPAFASSCVADDKRPPGGRRHQPSHTNPLHCGRCPPPPTPAVGGVRASLCA